MDYMTLKEAAETVSYTHLEQRRHVPDDRPHAPVLLSGYV